MKPKLNIVHRFTAVMLAVLMMWLGWFVRSETAHDHLHFHPASGLQLAAKIKRSSGLATKVVTQTPRWLKVASPPAGSSSQAPAGAHHHRSLAFDSLAAGQWCGLFTPAALPVLDLPAVAGLVPHRLIAPPRTHWLLLPGRAPPTCA